VVINSETEMEVKEKMQKQFANDRYLLQLFHQSLKTKKDFISMFEKQNSVSKKNP